jgi:hypothetical protein
VKRSGEPQRLTPMPRAQARMRARRQRRTARDRQLAADERRARLIVRERSGGLCEADRQHRATDYAHRVAEGQGGPWCPSNALHLCRAHHGWAHTNVTAARELGWILRSTDDPLAEPALIWLHGAPARALLHPDGSISTLPDPP